MKVISYFTFVLWVFGIVNLLTFNTWLPSEITIMLWAWPAGFVAGQALGNIAFKQKV